MVARGARVASLSPQISCGFRHYIPPGKDIFLLKEMDSIPKSTLSLVLKAVQFAVRAHGGQKRKATGVPYITHPIDVAQILVDEAGCMDPSTLVAAVLHDVVEDTRVTAAEIETVFGGKVASIVLEVSDDKRKREQIRKFPTLSWEAAQVKVADKISNLRDQMRNPIDSWSIERIQGYGGWCDRVVFSAEGVPRNKYASPILVAVLRGILDNGEFQRDGNTYSITDSVTEQDYYDIVDGRFK